jgi:hypothetical protein
VCLANFTNKNMAKCGRPWCPPLSFSRYGATRPATKLTQQSTYIICDRDASLNLEKILIITINMTIIAHRVVDDVRRRRIDDKTIGTAWPT